MSLDYESIAALDKVKVTLSDILPLLSQDIRCSFERTYVALRHEFESLLKEVEYKEVQINDLEQKIAEYEDKPEYPEEVEKIFDIMNRACYSGFTADMLEELCALHKSFMKYERNTIL